jgi:hypothetical protein
VQDQILGSGRRPRNYIRDSLSSDSISTKAILFERFLTLVLDRSVPPTAPPTRYLGHFVPQFRLPSVSRGKESLVILHGDAPSTTPRTFESPVPVNDHHRVCTIQRPYFARRRRPTWSVTGRTLNHLCRRLTSTYLTRRTSAKYSTRPQRARDRRRYKRGNVNHVTRHGGKIQLKIRVIHNDGALPENSVPWSGSLAGLSVRKR